MAAIFPSIDFEPNPLYESIISDLLAQDYSVLDDFFDPHTIGLPRNSLLLHFEEDRFKKAAIGNRTNELVAVGIRGDYILWIDEQLENPATQLFFKEIHQFVAYLNRSCFMGLRHMEFHYALYPPGTGYKRHIDAFQNDDRRKLYIAIYLN